MNKVSQNIISALDNEKQQLATFQREFMLKKLSLNVFKLNRHLRLKDDVKMFKTFKIMKSFARSSKKRKV